MLFTVTVITFNEIQRNPSHTVPLKLPKQNLPTYGIETCFVIQEYTNSYDFFFDSRHFFIQKLGSNIFCIFFLKPNYRLINGENFWKIANTIIEPDFRNLPQITLHRDRPVVCNIVTRIFLMDNSDDFDVISIHSMLYTWVNKFINI